MGKQTRRQIVVNEEIYYWFYKGGTYVVIWNPKNKKCIAPDWEVAGFQNPDDGDRAKHKRYFSITPRDVEKYIKVNGI